MQCDVWMSRILLVTVMWQGNGNKTQPNGVKFNCAVASKNSRNHRCLYHHHSPIGCSMLLLYWSSNWWKKIETRISMATALCKHAKNVFSASCACLYAWTLSYCVMLNSPTTSNITIPWGWCNWCNMLKHGATWYLALAYLREVFLEIT